MSKSSMAGKGEGEMCHGVRLPWKRFRLDLGANPNGRSLPKIYTASYWTRALTIRSLEHTELQLPRTVERSEENRKQRKGEESCLVWVTAAGRLDIYAAKRAAGGEKNLATEWNFVAEN